MYHIKYTLICLFRRLYDITNMVSQGKYSLFDIVNAKTFVAELIRILFSAIGCILVIPISAYITASSVNKVYDEDEKE